MFGAFQRAPSGLRIVVSHSVATQRYFLQSEAPTMLPWVLIFTFDSDIYLFCIPTTLSVCLRRLRSSLLFLLFEFGLFTSGFSVTWSVCLKLLCSIICPLVRAIF